MGRSVRAREKTHTSKHTRSDRESEPSRPHSGHSSNRFWFRGSPNFQKPETAQMGAEGNYKILDSKQFLTVLGSRRTEKIIKTSSNSGSFVTIPRHIGSQSPPSPTEASHLPHPEHDLRTRRSLGAPPPPPQPDRRRDESSGLGTGEGEGEGEREGERKGCGGRSDKGAGDSPGGSGGRRGEPGGDQERQRERRGTSGDSGHGSATAPVRGGGTGPGKGLGYSPEGHKGEGEAARGMLVGQAGHGEGKEFSEPGVRPREREADEEGRAAGQHGGGAGPGAAESHRCAASTRRASCPSCRACGRTPRGTGSTGGPPSPRRGSARLPGPGTAPERCTPAPPASAGSAPRRAPPPCRWRPKPWGSRETRRRRRTRCRRPRGEQE